MKKSNTRIVLLAIFTIVLVANSFMLVTHNVFGITDGLMYLFNNGWFAEYLNGKEPTVNRCVYFVYDMGRFLSYAVIAYVFYRTVSFRYIASKLIVALYCVFACKDVVFYLLNNNKALQWLDWILYGAMGLFLIFRAWRWQYERLTTDELNPLVLQYLITRPSKMKHVLGMVRYNSAAGTYRALINGMQYHFPDRTTMKGVAYTHKPGHVIKTARYKDGSPVLIEQALQYIENHKNDSYHFIQCNCNNFWKTLVLPSHHFKVYLKQ